VLQAECANIFRFGHDTKGSPGVAAQLHKHQQEAIEITQCQESYVLTTSTGFGKSLSYMAPVVDAVLNAKTPHSNPSIKAIITDPMNAFINSQIVQHLFLKKPHNLARLNSNWVNSGVKTQTLFWDDS
jgi:hypothetical protein